MEPVHDSAFADLETLSGIGSLAFARVYGDERSTSAPGDTLTTHHTFSLTNKYSIPSRKVKDPSHESVTC